MSQKTDAEIIEEMGGTYQVAALCGVKPPSVSEWKKSGIPQARRMYLQLLKPDIFNQPYAAIPAASAQPADHSAAGGVRD